MVRCNLKPEDVAKLETLEDVNGLIMYVSCAIAENERDHARTQKRKFEDVMRAAVARHDELEKGGNPDE